MFDDFLDNYIANMAPDKLVYGILIILGLLMLFAIIRYLFDRSGGYF